MCRRPEIAKMNGVPWELFKDTKEAIAATDEMIAKNRLDFPHIDGSRDVLTTVASHITSKFYYIHVDGVIIACINLAHGARTRALAVATYFYTPKQRCQADGHGENG